jgi:hypothetical protein
MPKLSGERGCGAPETSGSGDENAQTSDRFPSMF